jgi:hypothetical protein
MSSLAAMSNLDAQVFLHQINSPLQGLLRGPKDEFVDTGDKSREQDDNSVASDLVENPFDAVDERDTGFFRGVVRRVDFGDPELCRCKVRLCVLVSSVEYTFCRRWRVERIVGGRES